MEKIFHQIVEELEVTGAMLAKRQRLNIASLKKNLRIIAGIMLVISFVLSMSGIGIYESFAIYGGAIGLSTYLGSRFIKYPSNEIKITVEIAELIERHKKIGTFKIRENIDSILEKIEQMNAIISESNNILKEERIINFSTLLKKEILFGKLILENLKKDLVSNIRKELSTIKEGKEIINAHIQENSNFESVLSLQKERLDKQIEQFEELQKVLVQV